MANIIKIKRKTTTGAPAVAIEWYEENSVTL